MTPRSNNTPHYKVHTQLTYHVPTILQQYFNNFKFPAVWKQHRPIHSIRCYRQPNNAANRFFVSKTRIMKKRERYKNPARVNKRSGQGAVLKPVMLTAGSEQHVQRNPFSDFRECILRGRGQLHLKWHITGLDSQNKRLYIEGEPQTDKG